MYVMLINKLWQFYHLVFDYLSFKHIVVRDKVTFECSLTIEPQQFNYTLARGEKMIKSNFMSFD